VAAMRLVVAVVAMVLVVATLPVVAMVRAVARAAARLSLASTSPRKTSSLLLAPKWPASPHCGSADTMIARVKSNAA
jgi:hypothetical protein